MEPQIQNPDQNSTLVLRMGLAENKIDGVYYYFARYLGVNENTLALLYALNDGKPHSQKAVSEQWLIPRTTINSIVKRLMAEGYISFVPEHHTREKALILTPKGQTYTNRLLRPLYEAEDTAIRDTLTRYSPEFVDALDYFANRLYECFDETTRGKGPDIT